MGRRKVKSDGGLLQLKKTNGPPVVGISKRIRPQEIKGIRASERKSVNVCCMMYRCIRSQPTCLHKLCIPLLHDLVHVCALQRLFDLVHRIFLVVRAKLDHLTAKNNKRTERKKIEASAKKKRGDRQKKGQHSTINQLEQWRTKNDAVLARGHRQPRGYRGNVPGLDR